MNIMQFHVPSTIVFTGKDGTKQIFMKHEELGHGGFACVYRVTQQYTNKEYAIKVISKQLLNSKGKITLEKLKNELKIQKALNHPNIVRSKLSFADEFNYYIVLEYCPGKSVRDYLRKSEHGYLSESETRKIIRDVMKGLVYLHNKNVIHHDIKLENFIIGANGIVKIADFGLSTVLKNDDQKSFTICGTTSYLSPETLKKEGNGFEVDIWAIGVATFIMLTGQPPFGNLKKEIIYENIKSGIYSFPTNIEISIEAKSFIKTILRVNPEERPTAISLSNHPFLTKFDTELIDFFKSSQVPPKVQSSAPIQNYFNILPVNPVPPYQKIQSLIPTDENKIDTYIPIQTFQKPIPTTPPVSAQSARSPTPSQSSQNIRSLTPSVSSQNVRSPTPSVSSQKVRSPTPSQTSEKQRSPTPSGSTRKARSPTPSGLTRQTRSPTPSQTTQTTRSPLPSRSSQKVRSPTPSQPYSKADIIQKSTNDQNAFNNSLNTSRNIPNPTISHNKYGSASIRSSSVSSPRTTKTPIQSNFDTINNNYNNKGDSIRRSSSFSRKNGQLTNFTSTKKNFTIPNYFVVKFCLHGDDIGYLLGNGTVGVCFKNLSRIVMDPAETFIQYYPDHESSFESINLLNYLAKKKVQKANSQKDKLYNKITLAMRFAKSLKKVKSTNGLILDQFDSSVPLSHVKYIVSKNDSFLFKLSDKNVQVNFSDHTKMIIFWNSKKICFVKAISDKCCLLDINEVASMNSNCDERMKFKNAKLMLSDLNKNILSVANQ